MPLPRKLIFKFLTWFWIANTRNYGFIIFCHIPPCWCLNAFSWNYEKNQNCYQYCIHAMMFGICVMSTADIGLVILEIAFCVLSCITLKHVLAWKKINVCLLFMWLVSDALPDFAEFDQSEPHNCVVLGDAAGGFSYDNMNKAFRVLISQDKPLLISMGRG